MVAGIVLGVVVAIGVPAAVIFGLFALSRRQGLSRTDGPGRHRQDADQKLSRDYVGPVSTDVEDHDGGGGLGDDGVSDDFGEDSGWFGEDGFGGDGGSSDGGDGGGE